MLPREALNPKHAKRALQRFQHNAKSTPCGNGFHAPIPFLSGYGPQRGDVEQPLVASAS